METLPRLMVAGTSSSCGKTTVTLALLQAFLNRGLGVSSFKCGPDYLDPMLHRALFGAPGCNLDLFFTPPETLRGLLARYAGGTQLALLEGVMGFYDGIGSTSKASSSHVASETNTPAVLVVDMRGCSLSAAAVIRGFAQLEEGNMVRGAILNHCSEKLYASLAPAIEQASGIRLYGYLPRLPQARLESRQLGLSPAANQNGLHGKIKLLASQAEKSIDLQGLLRLAHEAGPIGGMLPRASQIAKVQVAIAKDAAFCFTYPENLDFLRMLGANLVPFSPLESQSIPAGSHALYFPGGYPEHHLDMLSLNASMLASIREAFQSGMPLLAEGGGFLYLQEAMQDQSGLTYPMAGILPGISHPTGKLCRFGYTTLYAKEDSMLSSKGGSIRAQEFHYWDSSSNGSSYYAKKADGATGWDCIQAGPHWHAGFPSLSFWGNPEAAKRWIQAAANYAAKMIPREG